MIVHRDIKAENIFVSTVTQVVKLGDFGFSTSVSSHSDKLDTFCGSPPYAAPELFESPYYHGSSVDIWACGIVLYYLVTASMPFRADTVSKIKQLVLNGTYSLPIYLSGECQTLIRSILRHVPAERASVGDLKSSEWLSAATFSEEFRVTNILPPQDESQQTKFESEAMVEMRSYGIDSDDILQARTMASKSDITGIYRILLHKRLQEESGIDVNHSEKSLNETKPVQRALARDGQKAKPVKQAESKLCNIL